MSRRRDRGGRVLTAVGLGRGGGLSARLVATAATVLAAAVIGATSSRADTTGHGYPSNLYTLVRPQVPGAPDKLTDGEPGALAPLFLGPTVEADGDLLDQVDGRLVRLDIRGRLQTHVPVPPHLRPFGATAPLADGSFLLVADNSLEVWQIYPDGSGQRVAGIGRKGDSGDGGPALDAQFESVGRLLALPDGGFLVVDDGRSRVRRVFPDGVIRAFAGNGHRGFSGDGGPATAARLDDIRDLTLLPDGSVLIVDTGNLRVRRVAPDGTITTVAGRGGQGPTVDGRPAIAAHLDFPQAVSALPDGSFVIGDFPLRKVDPAGAIGTLVSNRAYDFAGRNAVEISATAALDDGSVLLFTDEGLAMLASQNAERLAVALRDLSVSTRDVGALVDATRPTQATLQVLHGRSVVAQGHYSLAMGRNAIALTGHFKSGAYTVRVIATDAEGRVGADDVTSYLGDVLRVADAKKAEVANVGYGGDSETHYVHGCRRMGPQRVDCQVRFETFDATHRTSDRCTAIDSLRRARSGILQLTEYACASRTRGRFRQRPRLLFSPRPLPVAPARYDL